MLLCNFHNLIFYYLFSPTFSFEEEKENHNVFYRKSGEILYISVDLFLKKIAVEGLIDKNIFAVRGFIKQYTLFMKTDVLIDKTISLYKYFDSISQESKINSSKIF